MIMVKILHKLLLTAFIVGISMPYLHFDDILCPKIINDQIRALLISGSSLDVIISCTFRRSEPLAV